MSVNRAQTAPAENLSFEVALDALFDKILEQFRQSDLFSSPDQPVIFSVYAHDNPIVGTSHAWCVIHIIKWLEAAGCRAISDRNPLLPYSAQSGDSAAIRNILSNQFCLLPRGVCQRQAANERTHANKALVFCSEVLRQYCINASAREYVGTIEDVYKQCQGKPRDHLEQQLQLSVEDQARNGSAWFHHVLTEIAFLRLRKNLDCRDHGITPVALDGELPDYLPFVGSTDLVLKRESVSLHASDLHQTFFKVLFQIYPNQHFAIEKFKDCYMTLKSCWTSSGGTVARDSFDATIVKSIRQAHNSIMQQDQIATRHRLRGGYVAEAVEHTQERDLNAADVVLRKRVILSTLAPVPYRDRKDRNPERGEGTCIWFKDHSKFQEWHKSNGASLLWVSADPGCGKSVLAKYLVDEVLPTTGKQVACYFFFKDDFEDQRTLVGALRCLLHQLFKHNLSLLDLDVLTKFESDNQLLKSRTDLWKILTDALRTKPNTRPVFILDGFDECSANDRSFLMKNLKKLYMEDEPPPIKLLLTSRPYEDIARGLRQLQKRELIIHLKGESEQELDKISQEIDIVIEKNVDDLGEDLDLEPDVTALIKSELTKMENRTYLWVALMMEILKNATQTSKSAIQTLIQRLPRTVSAAYEKILSREQNDETNVKTRRLLHIIIAAQEPLTPGQIAVAFSMSERTPFDEAAISRDTKFVRDFSRLVIVIRNEKAYLAHQTVKDFLIMESLEPPENASLRPFVQWEHSFHPQDSNRVLAMSCMCYLEQCNSDDLIFLDYAAFWWSDHLHKSGYVDEMLVLRSRKLCDSSSKQFLRWFPRYWNMKFGDFVTPTKPTSLLVASLLGLKETTELLLIATEADLDAEDSCFHRTVFSWACHQGHLNVIEQLLDWISRSNTHVVHHRVLNAIDVQGNTPLHIATIQYEEWCRQFTVLPDLNLMGPYDNILSLLLSGGPNTNIQNIDGITPLHIAAKYSEALVKRLLQSGADVELGDNMGRTALHYACLYGNPSTMSRLLEHIVDIGIHTPINSVDRLHMTPLLYAIEGKEACQDIVKLLLDHNADVSLVCKLRNVLGHPSTTETPLIYAIKNGTRETAELLLSRGADYEIAPQEVLLKLIQSGNEGSEMVEFLLIHGADVTSSTESAKSPLLQAIKYENSSVVSLLLSHGLDVNSTSHDGITPLKQAILSRSEFMVEFLLDRGADVNAHTVEVNSPLFFALKYSASSRIIEILLCHGSNVNFVSRDGRTPLSVAVNTGNREQVKLLLDGGANFNSQVEIDARMSFSEATWFRKYEVVKILNEFGGNG